MEHIVLSTSLSGDGALEVHGLTDISIVGRTIVAGGIFLNSLDVGRLCVLFLNDNLFCSRSERAQSTKRTVYKVVTEVKVVEDNSLRISRLKSYSLDVVSFCISLCICCKICSLAPSTHVT